MEKQKTVDDYIVKNKQWQDALVKLREIMLSTEMEETVKWGAPVYTVEGKNVVGLGAFKSYVGIWFFQGALLEDRKGKLVNAQQGVTKVLRQWRFNDVSEIDPKMVKAYVEEAITNQKQGREIKPDRNKPLKISAELEKVLKANAELKKCFNEFNKSKQREFSDYLAEAKRAETKEKRLEKIIPMILRKQGLNDKYK